MISRALKMLLFGASARPAARDCGATARSFRATTSSANAGRHAARGTGRRFELEPRIRAPDVAARIQNRFLAHRIGEVRLPPDLTTHNSSIQRCGTPIAELPCFVCAVEVGAVETDGSYDDETTSDTRSTLINTQSPHHRIRPAGN
jgi:hypothetical protein